VPWQFNLARRRVTSRHGASDGHGYFFSARGPTTVERHDPAVPHLAALLRVEPATPGRTRTAQTMVAMANSAQQLPGSRWLTGPTTFRLFSTYTIQPGEERRRTSPRRPTPTTVSWDGHDTFFHSEHYFHSSYVDLVITGLAGSGHAPTIRWKSHRSLRQLGILSRSTHLVPRPSGGDHLGPRMAAATIAAPDSRSSPTARDWPLAVSSAGRGPLGEACPALHRAACRRPPRGMHAVNLASNNGRRRSVHQHVIQRSGNVADYSSTATTVSRLAARTGGPPPGRPTCATS